MNGRQKYRPALFPKIPILKNVSAKRLRCVNPCRSPKPWSRKPSRRSATEVNSPQRRRPRWQKRTMSLRQRWKIPKLPSSHLPSRPLSAVSLLRLLLHSPARCRRRHRHHLGTSSRLLHLQRCTRTGRAAESSPSQTATEASAATCAQATAACPGPPSTPPTGQPRTSRPGLTRPYPSSGTATPRWARRRATTSWT